MWKEFKEFAIKGNVVDLAVAVVIGAAFSKIIDSLVKDLIMPPIGVLTGGLDFSNKFIVIKAGANGATNFATPAAAEAAKAVTWNYGNFITASVNFIIIAFAIFMLVRALHKLKHPPPAVLPTVKDCPACTMSIPIKATRCPHCTSELAASPA